MRTVLVGVDPGKNSGGPFSGEGGSGRRLASLCGLSVDEFASRFDRINLHHSAGHPESADRRAAENLIPVLRGRRVVAVGGRVATALSVGGENLSWSVRERGFVGAKIPHPSGVSRWWNDRGNTLAASRFMKDMLRPCIHLEGPDGSGKTTLAGWISKEFELSLIPTDDPPKSEEECRMRVNRRVGTSVVCDRSSGLISELVYAPVLRGKTMWPEEQVWDLVRSIVHAVVFVYCRPPEKELRPMFREGEDPDHVRGVVEKSSALVNRYDDVMSRLVREGARVMKYDRTTQTPTEVLRCVE